MTVTEICSIDGTIKMNSDFGTFLLSHAALCNDAILHVLKDMAPKGNARKDDISITGEPTE